MENKLLSVIVPVYNAEKYLDRCIQSILNQTYSNIELLLIDDGSKDSSAMICDRYAKTNKRIKVYHKINGGVSSARNVGLDNAMGYYVAFVDADDYLLPHAYQTLIDNFKNDCHPIIGFIGGGNVKYSDCILGVYDTIRTLNETAGSCCGYIWHRLFKRESIGKQRFDTNVSFGEDAIFWFYYIVENNVKTFRFLEYVGYVYVKEVGSSSLTSKSYDANTYGYLLNKISLIFDSLVSGKDDCHSLRLYLIKYIRDRYVRFVNEEISKLDSLKAEAFYSNMKRYAQENIFISKATDCTLFSAFLYHSFVNDNINTFKKKNWMVFKFKVLFKRLSLKILAVKNKCKL